MPKTIDVHAHILNEDTMQMIAKEAPSLGSSSRRSTRTSRCSRSAASPTSRFRAAPGTWSSASRTWTTAEVDMHVLSNTPQTFLYNTDASLNAAVAALQNDQIAKHVKDQPDRFYGLATLPMQAPDKAAAELRRAMTTLGLQGRADRLQHQRPRTSTTRRSSRCGRPRTSIKALMMVHPTQVAGDRPAASNYYLNNLIGNPLDSTIAVASLVFGGVVERYPNIKWFFVHGGGMAPWQAGRFAHGWKVRPEPKVHLKDHGPEKAMATLYYDTILHAQPAARMPGVDWSGAVARRARQRLSLRHGHARMRPSGQGAVDLRRRQGPRSSTASRSKLVGESLMPQAIVRRGVARAFIDEVLRAAGLPAADATRVAELMTEADLTGADAHGIFRLPHYRPPAQGRRLQPAPDHHGEPDRAGDRAGRRRQRHGPSGDEPRRRDRDRARARRRRRVGRRAHARTTPAPPASTPRCRRITA